ncbi:MAG: FtsX-like permease family protein [Nocardioidaceae bacterium]
MRTLLAGLWARRGVNATGLLVAVVAATVSVLGPMYGRASGEHLLDSEIAARPSFETGLTMTRPAASVGYQLPRGRTAAWSGPAPAELVRQAATALDSPGVDRSWQPPHPWLQDQRPRLFVHGTVFTLPLYWRAGMCRLAHVDGRCPRAPGEVLVQQRMAQTLGVGVGDTIAATYRDGYRTRVRVVHGFDEVVRSRIRPVTYQVVGTYRVAHPETTAWFDPSRFLGSTALRPPGLGETVSSQPPPTAALLVAPSSMTGEGVVGGVDRPIDPARVNLDTMADVGRVAHRYGAALVDDPTSLLVSNLDLRSVLHDVRAQRPVLDRVMVAALAPLVVLAMLLLYVLVAAGMQQRRPHIALAKLRGHSRARVFRFAVAEPFLVVGLAVPVGAGLGVLGTQLITRIWFTAGIPVRPDLTTVLALASVAAAALVASAAAAVGVLREPLAASLSPAASGGSGSRFHLVAGSGVVAVALAVLAQLLTSGRQSSQLLALLAPLFVALAIAVGGTALLRLLGRGWLARTRAAGGARGFLAARRLARRRDLGNLMVPLLLAVSVILFAGSASSVADGWQRSRAAAETGAARTYLTDVSPGRLLAVTHRVDPRGRYLAAAVVDDAGTGVMRRVLFDTSRFAAVAAWQPSWSGLSPAALQRQLRPASLGQRITFRGSRLSVHLSDVHLTSKTHSRSALLVRYVDGQGETQEAQLGVLRNGAGQTLAARLSGCRTGCVLDQVFLAGTGESDVDANGRLMLTGVDLDGRRVDWGLTRPGAWRAARPFPATPVDPPVVLAAGPGGLRLRVYLGHLPRGNGPAPTAYNGIARITPAATPDVLPALVGVRTPLQPMPAPATGTGIDYPRGVTLGSGISGQPAPIRVVDRVAAVPGLGDVGELADLETALVSFQPQPGLLLNVELWTAPHTPASLLDAMKRAGVTLTPIDDEQATLHALRTNATSLGLRLFLLVGLATLLLAVFGLLASAVLQSRWRAYEVAALRVVGVRVRTLLVASVLEYVVMLGLAVVLGVVAACVSLTLVLPTISLGRAAPYDPAVAYGIDWPLVCGVAGGVFAVAVLVAYVVSAQVTRRGRPATLRSADPR